MNTNHTPGVAPGRAPHSRLSWGAVLAGVVLAIAVQLVLGILGAGIGLSLVDPVEGTTPGAGGFGIGDRQHDRGAGRRRLCRGARGRRA